MDPGLSVHRLPGCGSSTGHTGETPRNILTGPSTGEDSHHSGKLWGGQLNINSARVVGATLHSAVVIVILVTFYLYLIPVLTIPLQVGVIFMLYGFSYAVLSPVWGWLADRLSSTLVILLGALLLGLGSLLIGQSVILFT